ATTALGVAENPSKGCDYFQSPWHYQANDPAALLLTGVRPYWDTDVGASPLQANQPLHDFLIDEGGEVILSRRFSNPEFDAVFPTSEMEGLHLSESDFRTSGGRSRLRELAIVN